MFPCNTQTRENSYYKRKYIAPNDWECFQGTTQRNLLEQSKVISRDLIPNRMEMFQSFQKLNGLHMHGQADIPTLYHSNLYIL
jgi:hypothetical protein